MTEPKNDSKPTDMDVDTSEKKRKSSSSEKEPSSSKKQRALKLERQSHRRHFDDVLRSKEIWNKLRQKNNTKIETAAMMKDLMELIGGKIPEVAMQHDASRVVQAAIQFGNVEQRAIMMKELQGNIAEMAKSQYAHFVVLKLFKYCCRDDVGRKCVLKALKGKMAKLAVHAIGARVVEVLFATFPSKETAPLRYEFYGPQFALFISDQSCNKSTDANTKGQVQSTLKTLLEQNVSKRDKIMEHVHGVLNKGVDKGLFHFSYFQELFCEYMEAATSEEIREVTPNVVDHSIHMLSTRAGSKVVAQCAAYGTAKDRRRIMKSLKGYTRSSLLHRDAYIAILRLVDVTDDTVSIQKSVLAELLVDMTVDKGDEQKSPILDIALSDTAYKLFSLVLSKKDTSNFDPWELEMLQPATIKQDGETISTSKKNPETRQTEISIYLREALCNMALWHTDELMRTSIGSSKILQAVFHSFPSEDLATAIIKVCQEKPDEDSKVLSIFEDHMGHLFLKNLILADIEHNESKEEDDGKLSFCTVLFEAFRGNLMNIATSNRGAFVLATLVKHGAVRADIKKELKKSIKNIEKMAKDKKGFAALLSEIKKK